MRRLAFVAIGLATLLLALAYAPSAVSSWAVVIGVGGLLWLVGHERGWSWAGAMGLYSFLGATALGVWLGLPAGWMLLSAVVTLLAWDLDATALRLRGVANVQGEAQLVRSHLVRVLVVAGLGLLLGGLALSIRVDLSFWWALLLGMFVMLSLHHAVRFVQSGSD
jgi:hypothetical protein